MARGKVYNRIYNEEDWSKVNKDNKYMIEDFLEEYRQRKKKQSTIDQYFNDLRILAIYILKELDNRPFTELSKKDFRRMNIWLQNKGMSNARVNRLFSACRSMLTYIEDDDEWEYDNNIAKKIKGLSKEEVRDIYFLTNEQVEKLKNELIRRKDYIKALALSLAYDSAGRRNELFQVTKESILSGKGVTNVVVGKRGKKFPLLYFDWTKECAKLYFEQRGEDDIPELWVTGKTNKKPVTCDTLYNWFVQMANILQELEGKEIPFNAHSLRHSALENCSNSNPTHYILKLPQVNRPDGFTLEELKLYAHHSSTDTTASYLRNKDNEILGSMFGVELPQ